MTVLMSDFPGHGLNRKTIARLVVSLCPPYILTTDKERTDALHVCLPTMCPQLNKRLCNSRTWVYGRLLATDETF